MQGSITRENIDYLLERVSRVKAQELPIRQILGDDHIKIDTKQEEIGKGSYGRVLKQQVRGVMRAVKQMNVEQKDMRDVERIFNQIYVGKAKENLQIPKLIGFGIRENENNKINFIYIVMELYQTSFLTILLKNGAYFSDQTQLEIAIKIADTLNKFHNEEPRARHGDVNPSNILLDMNRFQPRKVALCDFGFSSLIDDYEIKPFELAGCDIYYFAKAIAFSFFGNGCIEASKSSNGKINFPVSRGSILVDLKILFENCMVQEQRRRPPMEYVLEQLILIKKKFFESQLDKEIKSEQVSSASNLIEQRKENFQQNQNTKEENTIIQANENKTDPSKNENIKSIESLNKVGDTLEMNQNREKQTIESITNTDSKLNQDTILEVEQKSENNIGPNNLQKEISDQQNDSQIKIQNQSVKLQKIQSQNL